MTPGGITTKKIHRGGHPSSHGTTLAKAGPGERHIEGSPCSDSITFIYREMQRHVQDSFGIILPTRDVVRVFGDKLKLSCIAAVPQVY